MKKFFYMVLCAIATATFAACGNDDDDKKVNLGSYQEWRQTNDAWVTEMQAKKNPDGTPYYQTVIPVWNPGGFVLMHFFNDRSETAANLVPLYTSEVDVIYKGYNCKGVGFDSSTYVDAYGQLGVARLRINNTIQGWGIAMEKMHVGDTAEVIVPYGVGYGATMTSSLLPYSSLRFNIRLVDIYKYQASPY